MARWLQLSPRWLQLSKILEMIFNLKNIFHSLIYSENITRN